MGTTPLGKPDASLGKPSSRYYQIVRDLLTAVELLVLATILSAAAGIVTGIKVGGRLLARRLAALMGAFYGPIAVIPAALLGVIIFGLLK